MELTVSVSWEIMAAFTKEFLLSAQVHEVLTLNYNTAKVKYLKDMRTKELLTHLSLSKFNAPRSHTGSVIYSLILGTVHECFLHKESNMQSFPIH